VREWVVMGAICFSQAGHFSCSCYMSGLRQDEEGRREGPRRNVEILRARFRNKGGLVGRSRWSG